EINFEVIFTTAYDKYALKAIKFCALDYLLKPVDPTELKASVARFVEGRKKAEAEKGSEDVGQKEANSKKIALPAVDSFHLVAFEEIVRCEAAANYCLFVLADGRKLTVSRPLKAYAEVLGEAGFLRVHQSHMVNLEHVRSYARGMARFVVMSDGTQVEVSRRHREALVARLEQYRH
ncbi:MAG: LytTR family DNA-binding domain-containing protein, partial [Bacteroidota bacterium]